MDWIGLDWIGSNGRKVRRIGLNGMEGMKGEWRKESVLGTGTGVWPASANLRIKNGHVKDGGLCAAEERHVLRVLNDAACRSVVFVALNDLAERFLRIKRVRLDELKARKQADLQESVVDDLSLFEDV